MIIKRQHIYSVRTKILSPILKKADVVAVNASKKARIKGAKVVAKSMNKGAVEEKIQQIRAKYPSNPEIAERKIAQFRKKSSGRIQRFQEDAQRKLEAINPSRVAKTDAEIVQQAHNITHPTVESTKAAVQNTGKAVVNGSKSVLQGAKTLYTGTGKAITTVASKAVENPGFEVAMRVGDAANIVGTATGNGWILGVPTGGILAGPMVAAQNVIIPRGARRKLRQTGIKIRKSKLSNWSLQKTVQDAKPYYRAPGYVGA